MSFYAAMDRVHIAVVSSLFSLLGLLTGCGDAGTSRIDGPGPSSNNQNQKPASPLADASTDQGNGYRDPAVSDGGCLAPNVACTGVCTALESDPTNCGACGNACIGTDSVCNAGLCACAGPLQDYCTGVGCMDVSTDFNNCGACGNACDPVNDQACSGGVCIPNCP